MRVGQAAGPVEEAETEQTEVGGNPDERELWGPKSCTRGRGQQMA